jgi:hypothetical protein
MSGAMRKEKNFDKLMGKTCVLLLGLELFNCCVDIG